MLGFGDFAVFLACYVLCGVGIIWRLGCFVGGFWWLGFLGFVVW